MSLELLDKTRKINYLLNEEESEKVDFGKFSQVLAETMQVDVLLLSKKGKVLGLKERKGLLKIPELEVMSYGKYVDEVLRDRFLSILSTKENVNLLTLGFESDEAMHSFAMIVPVNMAGRRLGTLLVYRQENAFSIDDIILAEYATTVIGLAMQHAESEEISEEQHKEKDILSLMNTLSHSEVEAMSYVLVELNGASSGTLVTSRLADKVGITRSVIVNALRKCESAGIIKTKSYGMKGTYIQIENELFNHDAVTEIIQKQNAV